MISLVIVLICLVVLVKSADVFVDHAGSLAKKLKVSDFLIGFTVVAFGTSMPEMVSTLFASISGHNQLAVSNILGSNMTNLCLILGIIAVLNDYRIHKLDVHLNIPLNIAALAAFWVLAVWMKFDLSWAAGISLILVFLVLILTAKEYNHDVQKVNNFPEFSLIKMLVSLVVLIAAGKVAVDQIIIIAGVFNISETILGYFLLAVGTSLPELATTWATVKKHDGEMGVGNILGSNMFNLLFITGIASFINPVNLHGFTFDLGFLTLATLATYVFAMAGRKYSFSHKEGVGLLMIYALFVALQISR